MSGNCCPVGPIEDAVEQYKDRLEFAKAQGFLNRTLFCFGFILAQSPTNPFGWTRQSLRVAMLKLKVGRSHIIEPLASLRPQPVRGNGACLHRSIKLAPESGFDMCFAIGSQHHRYRGSQPKKHVSNPDSVMKMCNPHLIYDCLRRRATRSWPASSCTCPLVTIALSYPELAGAIMHVPLGCHCP